MLRGIIPPIPTPLDSDETIDVPALRRLLELNVAAGVHGIWVLGTTGRFDLVTDGEQRRLAEQVAEIVAGRVPLVLNISDMGTRRVLERAAAFDDLPYDAYAVLCPWYREMTKGELTEFFTRLADELSRPLVIYNAPWVQNMLSFDHVRKLAEHPRIVGVKDVTASLTRPLSWPRGEREALGFSYMHGSVMIATSAALGADGFVTGLAGVFPELCVATWNAVRSGDDETAARYERQLMKLSAALENSPPLACLEVMAQHRGIAQRISAHPQSRIDAATARKVIDTVEESGALGVELLHAEGAEWASP
jgi:4-hydroxy-tetrahydrodipicolinate synthase